MSGPAPGATPSIEEINRIRQLISRLKGDFGQLPAAERAQIDQAVAVVRKHRAPPLSVLNPEAGMSLTEA